MSGVLFGAAVVQLWLAQIRTIATVCVQQQLEQQQWVLSVRWMVRRTVRGSVSVR